MIFCQQARQVRGGCLMPIVWSAEAQTPSQTIKPEERLGWAFQVINGQLPPEPDESMTIPGSTRKYTRKQIDDLMNPPDWFPESHAPAPAPVTTGRGAMLACGACHLMNGAGHPESADMAGLPKQYLIRTMENFKERHQGRTVAHERHREGDDGRGD
jgi:hypothetical protein